MLCIGKEPESNIGMGIGHSNQGSSFSSAPLVKFWDYTLNKRQVTRKFIILYDMVCLGCLRTGYWGEYLDITGSNRGWTEWMNSFKICTLYQIGYYFMVSKPNRMRWAGCVVRMGDMWNIYRSLLGKPEGKSPLERPRLNGSIILEWIVKNGRVWHEFIWLKVGAGGGFLWLQ